MNKILEAYREAQNTTEAVDVGEMLQIGVSNQLPAPKWKIRMLLWQQRRALEKEGWFNQPDTLHDYILLEFFVSDRVYGIISTNMTLYLVDPEESNAWLNWTVQRNRILRRADKRLKEWQQNKPPIWMRFFL